MEDKASTRDQIMAGARRMFAEKGFRASMRDIAQAAGISTTSLIFWYFPDKEALWSAVIQEASPLAQVHDVLLHRDPAERPSSVVRALVEAYFRVYQDRDNRQLFFHILSYSSQGSVAQVLRSQLTEVLGQQMVTLVREGQDQGAFRQDLSAAFLAQAVLGILWALVTRLHVDETLPWTVDEVTDSLLRLITTHEIGG